MPRAAARKRRGRQEDRRRRQVRATLPGQAADRWEQAATIGRRVRPWREMLLHPAGDELLGRLLSRRSVYDTARWFREQLRPGDPLLGLSELAIARRLYRLRAALPPEIVLPEGELDEKFRRPGLQLDVLEEMATLVRYQKTRVEKFMASEDAFPVSLEQQRREVTTLMMMLVDYRDTAMALHVIDGTPPGSVVIDARSVDARTVVLGDPTSQALADMMQARPALIPKVMDLFDEMDAVQTDGADAG